MLILRQWEIGGTTTQWVNLLRYNRRAQSFFIFIFHDFFHCFFVIFCSDFWFFKNFGLDFLISSKKKKKMYVIFLSAYYPSEKETYGHMRMTSNALSQIKLRFLINKKKHEFQYICKHSHQAIQLRSTFQHRLFWNHICKASRGLCKVKVRSTIVLFRK